MDTLEPVIRRFVALSHPPDLAKAMGVERSTAFRWKKGGEIPPLRLYQLGRLLGLDPEIHKEAAPPWALALAERLDRIAKATGADVSDLSFEEFEQRYGPALAEAAGEAHRAANGESPTPEADATGDRPTPTRATSKRQSKQRGLQGQRV